LAGRLATSIGAMMAGGDRGRGGAVPAFEKEGTAKKRQLLGTEPQEPFSLGPALKFAAFFVAILFVAKIAKLYLGNEGLYLAALASGLADVDAITLSIAEQTKSLSLATGTGAIAITIAVVPTAW